MYIVVGLFPVFLGLAAAALVKTDPGLKAEIGDSEQVVAILSQHFLPKWHYVVFGGALVSAILSVVHSALHASGAQVSHNIVVRVVPSLGPGRDRFGLRQCGRIRHRRVRHVHTLWRRVGRGGLDLHGHDRMGRGAFRLRMVRALSPGDRLLGGRVYRGGDCRAWMEP